MSCNNMHVAFTRVMDGMGSVALHAWDRIGELFTDRQVSVYMNREARR
jgi:hypothetical protein